jgi:hypothetical protein
MADAAEPAAPSAPSDEFAAQKASTRDTAKWMATAYAVVAAVVIAGTPFSGLGALDNEHLATTVIAGGISVICILVAINSILGILIGGYAFAGSLDETAKKFIDDHATDILPIQFESLEDFLANRKATRSEAVKLWQRLTRPQQPPLDVETRQTLEARYLIYLDRSGEDERNVARIVSLAHLFLLRNELSKIRRRLVLLTAVSVISLVVAVWAATSVKKAESGSRFGELRPDPVFASVIRARSADQPRPVFRRVVT